MKNSIYVASLVLFCFCFSAYSWPAEKKSKDVFKDCSKHDDKGRMEIKGVTVTPTKPKKGDQVTIKIDTELKEEVTSGEVKLSLKYGNIPIVDETLDFCDLVTQINKQCPLKKGPFTINFDKQSIPDYIPSGNYEGKVVCNDQDGKELVCFEIDLHL